MVASGKITKCSDGKDKKVDDCGELLFDPLALPKIRDLAKCSAAMGLEGKLSIGFEIDFKSKEIHVLKGKKTTLPQSTVQGVLKCATQEFASVALEDVPHKHRRYTLYYAANFYPPGKHPDEEAADRPKEEGEESAGTTTNEASATGTATVSWDTAPIPKRAEDGRCRHARREGHSRQDRRQAKRLVSRRSGLEDRLGLPRRPRALTELPRSARATGRWTIPPTVSRRPRLATDSSRNRDGSADHSGSVRP